MDLCGFLNGTDEGPIVKWLVGMIRNSFPKNLLHPCPYIGEVKVYNLTMEVQPVLSQFLVGRYRSFFKIYDDQDDNILTMNLEWELT
jgi:hypothetical protein